MKLFTIKDNRILGKIAVLIFWVLVWELIYIIIDKEILIVSPFSVILRLKSLIKEKSFWEIIFLSLFRIMNGFLLGIIIGVLLAIVTYRFLIVRSLIEPIISVIRSTPVVSFIVIALVFIRSQYLPVFISFLMVMPIIYTNMNYGIANVDRKLLEMANIYRVSLYDKLIKIYVPSIIPSFKAACISSIGFAFKAGISAELISNVKMSIGGQIYNSKIYMDTLDLFSWTIVIIIISILIEYVIVKFIGCDMGLYHYKRNK